MLLNDTNRNVESKDVIFDERMEQAKCTATVENRFQVADVGCDLRLDGLLVSDMTNVNGGHDNGAIENSQLQDKKVNGTPIPSFAKKNDGDYSVDQFVASKDGEVADNYPNAIDEPVVQVNPR